MVAVNFLVDIFHLCLFFGESDYHVHPKHCFLHHIYATDGTIVLSDTGEMIAIHMHTSNGVASPPASLLIDDCFDVSIVIVDENWSI